MYQISTQGYRYIQSRYIYIYIYIVRTTLYTELAALKLTGPAT